MRAGKKGQYVHVGVLQFEGENNVDQQLNFTHRSTLGGGDDADAASSYADLAQQ